MVVAADRVIRTTPFACRHKNKLCVIDLTMCCGSRCRRRFRIFNFCVGWALPIFPGSRSRKTRLPQTLEPVCQSRSIRK